MSEVTMACPVSLDEESGKTLYGSVRKRKLHRGQTLILDLSPTKSMDTLGGAWLVEISAHLQRRHATLRCEGACHDIDQLMGFVEPALAAVEDTRPHEPGFIEWMGERTISLLSETREFLDLIVDAVYWTLLAPFEGKGFRWGLLVDEIYEMGVRAVSIVCMMNFLLGVIIAMLSGAQVEGFGLAIYVADLMVIGFSRELAAIMTAIVVSARTGAAIAAELATMKVQEEIDALRGMGLNVTQFLVAPKLLALVICLPCLVALGLASGIAGGSLWGIMALGFRPTMWFTQTLNAADLGDLMQGFLKTFFFAVGIALIGCHNGLRVTGGSRGVGLMTTRSVVMDIFMLICVDIVFAAIFYYVLE